MRSGRRVRRISSLSPLPSEASPGSPGWNIRANLVARALRLIAAGLVDAEGVAGKDADLRALARAPLMLNVLTVAYQGDPSEKLAATGSLGMKQEQVFASYVQRMKPRRDILYE